MKLRYACVLLLAGFCTAAGAESWPSRTVTLVVPYPAGAGLDPIARQVGQKMATTWKVPVVVENKPGANGSLGAAEVARARPDGYTILMSGIAEVAINQYVQKGMAYDPVKDLRPVTQLAMLPLVLVTRTASRFTSMDVLLASARRNPGGITYSSSGIGSSQHLATVLMEQLGGIRLSHVPYQGIAPALTDLVGGHVDVGFAGLPAASPFFASGTLRPLGISSREPAPAAPDIPPIDRIEGLKGYEMTQWFGVFLPARASDEITRKLQASVASALESPEVRQSLKEQGVQPGGMSTAEFSQFLDRERAKFAEVVRGAGIE